MNKNSIKKFLHVGCGRLNKKNLNNDFNSPEWEEVRVDLDPANQPDILSSMTDLSAIESNSIDAIYSSHSIEHLFAHEVFQALTEFNRVLNDDGFLILTCPDLQTVCALVAEDKLTDTAYQSGAGPIAPIDMIYGHRTSIMQGNVFMAHKSGFTKKVLTATLLSVNFESVAVLRRELNYDLWSVATKKSANDDRVQYLASHFFDNSHKTS
jgi:predicted SAM-dependent methyltransferase